MSQDLRSFIEKVRQESPEDVLTISKEVDPRFEITALVVKLEQERRFPIMVFENVKGTKIPCRDKCARLAPTPGLSHRQ